MEKQTQLCQLITRENILSEITICVKPTRRYHRKHFHFSRANMYAKRGSSRKRQSPYKAARTTFAKFSSF